MHTFLRCIFGTIVFLQLIVVSGFLTLPNNFGADSTIHNLIYTALGFIFFFEVLLPRAKLPHTLYIVIYSFAVLAYLTEIIVEDLALYKTTFLADILAHFSAAALLAFIGYLIITGDRAFAHIPYKKYFVISTLTLIMVLHEIYEYGSDKILGTQALGIGATIYDTAEDLLLGLLGTLCGLLVGIWIQHKKLTK